MLTEHTLILAWTLLAAFLALGLLLYERTGMRLGGVLVLPLLIIYALFDLNVLAVFAISATAALIVGHILYNRTFLYGRRLLYVFLIVGIASTLVARQYVDTVMGGFVVALLPGLFAYNMHREGRYLEGTTAFLLWLGILLAGAVGVVWLVARPDEVHALADTTRAGAATSLFPLAQDLAASALHHVADLGARMASGMDSLAAWTVGTPDAVATTSGLKEGALATGTAGVALVQSLHDEGVAE